MELAGDFEAHLTVAAGTDAEALARACEELGIGCIAIELATGAHAAQPMTASRHRGAYGDVVVEVSVPTVGDLGVASAARDPQDASRILLNCCLHSLRRGEDCIAADTLPDDAVAAIEAALEAGDPLAVCDFEVCCPACGAVSECAFDIASFLWHEVESRAMQIVRDVHVLAREYGWHEADILAMPASRRRLYLEMVGA